MSATSDAVAVIAASDPARHESRATRLARWLARSRALLRARGGHIVLIGAAAGALDFLRALPLLAGTAAPIAPILAQIVSHAMALCLLVVIGISLGQAASPHGWRQALLMLGGAWAGVAVGAAAAAAMSQVGWNYIVSERIVSSLAGNLMYLGWEYLAIGTGVALFYAAQAREAGLAARARETELDQLEAQRTMMESRLAVLRARVEPEFLFGALDDMRSLYLRDRGAADALIDALIAYLRAALPQMRGEGSTIGREIDLARAYVAVLQAPRADMLAVEADVADSVRDIVLPPMVLLPIAQAVFACGDVDARRRFAITATESPEGVAIAVEVDGGQRPAAWCDGGPETARQTLAAYFGNEARLDFATEGLRHRATIRLSPAAVRPAVHGAPAGAHSSPRGA